MVLIDLQKVLSTLGLVSSLAKPVPLVGSLAGGLLDAGASVVNSTVGSATGPGSGAPGGGGGALGALLGGAGSGLIAAVNVASLNGTIVTVNSTSGGNTTTAFGAAGAIGANVPATSAAASANTSGSSTSTLLSSVVSSSSSSMTGSLLNAAAATSAAASKASTSTSATSTSTSTHISISASASSTSTSTSTSLLPPTSITASSAAASPTSDPLSSAGTSTSGITAQDADSCAFTPYSPPSPVTLEPFAAYDASQALIYRYRQQQAVNLGSWFVQEQWMNPSLFSCAAGNKQAELDVANGWGSVDNARQVLERHWDEWISESDFKYLAGVGINTVRLPIGFWSVGPVYCQGTPFEAVADAYVNSWPRVVRAINWAAKYGLGVLVDLHGAPGSQNGQAHSGVSDGQQNLFDNPTNVQLTINVLTYLTQQLVKVNNVVGIQILNEPSNVDGLPAFYSQVLGVLRQVSPEAAAFPFYINDAFDMSRFADYISTRQDFVVLDHHSYFVFGDAASQATPASQLTSTLQPGQGSLSQQMISASNEERRNIVIDEFSCALSQQALSASSDPQGDRRQFCTGQMESYANATAGYAFWSYKTENCATDVNWCFTSAVGSTLPSTFFSYPKSTIQAINSNDKNGDPASSSASGSSDSDAASSSPSQGNDSDTPITPSSFLSFGTSSPDMSDYSPPTMDDWLAAMGNSNSEFASVTEALATTEYDRIPGSGSGSGNGESSPSSVPAYYASSYGPQIPALAQAAYALDPTINTALDSTSNSDILTPTASTHLPNLGARRSHSSRSLLPAFAERAFLLSSSLNRHRFVARHHRASSRAHSRPVRKRDDGAATSTATTNGNGDDGEQNVMYTPEQAAIAKGYADGWKAAKTFAAFNSSRLGFTGQFISDALNAMDDQIVSSDEQFYRTWFMKGLADGEVQVIKMLALQEAGPQ